MNMENFWKNVNSRKLMPTRERFSKTKLAEINNSKMNRDAEKMNKKNK